MIFHGRCLQGRANKVGIEVVFPEPGTIDTTPPWSMGALVERISKVILRQQNLTTIQVYFEHEGFVLSIMGT